MKKIQQIILIILINVFAATSMTIIYSTSIHLEGILVHTLLYMCLVYSLMILIKKVKISYIIVNALEWLFGIISILKIETRGQEFVPWDLSLTRNIFELASFAQVTPRLIFNILSQTFFIIAITIVEIYAFGKLCEIPKKSGKKFILILSLVVFMFFPFKYKTVDMKYVLAERKGFENYGRRRGMNHYGAFFNFILDVGVADIKENEQYSIENIKKLQQKYDTYSLSATEEYDNVIMILMESFVDLEKIIEQDFEKDVLLNYHKYAQKYMNGTMKVDVIGGGTANVEYQVVTMHSLEKYPDGIFPYIHYIRDDITSLPKIFKENGYNTTAIHTYKEGFYNRENVFEFMGFDKYISDDDFENPNYYGKYIDDMEIYDEIIKTIEDEEKSFIHAITMSPHTPYPNSPQYTDKDIVGEEFGKHATSINNYLYSLQKTDQMLGKLVEYVEKSEEKTLVIVYGDHFPLFNKILEDLRMIETDESSIDVEKYPRLYETPYMIISNSETALINNRGNIEPNEMGMYVLENVKLEKVPWIYKLFYNYFMGKEEEANYELIQYDQIHGEKYWKGL